MKTKKQRGVTVLGSTGSIGKNTLDVIERYPDLFRLEALVANRSVDLLIEQAKKMRPRLVVVADPSAYGVLKEGLAGCAIEVAAGEAAVIAAAELPEADIVMAAIVGAAGLKPTLAAVRRGATIALANKECLVCAGALMMAEAARCDARIVPVDSEHSAIFQVFDTAQKDSIEKIILTASGGPFRTLSRAEMTHVTPAQAVSHPNWSMGAKISVDSASMMNKGLELIEAHHLFALPESCIDIVVHPQSAVHSLVAYKDGSVLAQLGCPDMRTPIAYALGWPERLAIPVERLDLVRLSQLTFEKPDEERFPTLRLARQALREGGGACTVLNAANEVAVEFFLNARLGFLGICDVIEETLNRVTLRAPSTLDQVFDLDRQAREMTRMVIASHAQSCPRCY